MAEFWKVQRGDDVIVRGRRVPMLEAYHLDGGQTRLVFDRRLGLVVGAADLDAVAEFVADVMENVMNPGCGRAFNTVHEITSIETKERP